jgi:hypothetical protein
MPRAKGEIHIKFALYSESGQVLGQTWSPGWGMSLHTMWAVTDGYGAFMGCLLVREGRHIFRKICPSDTLLTTNPTLTGLGLGLQGKTPTSNLLCYGRTHGNVDSNKGINCAWVRLIISIQWVTPQILSGCEANDNGISCCCYTRSIVTNSTANFMGLLAL